MDRAFARTFRNLSTLLLIAAVVTVPLHFAHSFIFRDVIAVDELREDIADLPEGRLVRNVGTGDFATETRLLLAVGLLELAAVPLFARAAARALQMDATDEVPTVSDAYRNASEGPPVASLAGGLGPRAGGVLVAGAAGWLTYRIGMLVTEVLGADRAWVGVGITRGLAVALAIAIATGVHATLLDAAPPQPRPEEPLDLY